MKAYPTSISSNTLTHDFYMESIKVTIAKQHTDLLVGSGAFGGSDGQAGSVATAKCKVAYDQ